jgi:hypothetical protein
MAGAVVGNMFTYHASRVSARYPFTSAGWIYIDITGSVFCAFAGTGLANLELNRAGADGHLRLTTSGGSVDTGYVLDVDNWYYVALAITETTQQVYVGEDGGSALTLAGSYTNTLTGYGDNSIQLVHYRDDSNVTNALLEWRGWDAELSQAQLEAEAASATPVISSDLVYDYRFVSGALQTDSSGNGYTLTAGGLSDWGGALPSFGAPAGDMAGSSAGAATVAGTLTGVGALSGTIAGAATPTANLTAIGALAGIAAGAASTAAVLTGGGALAGVAAGVAAVAGVLVGTGALSALAAGAASAVATLVGRGALSGAAAGAASTIATLLGRGDMSGTAAGSATVTGALDGAVPSGDMTGVAAGSATATATLVGYGRLAGASHGTSTAEIDNADRFVFPDAYRLSTQVIDVQARAAVVDTTPRQQVAA